MALAIDNITKGILTEELEGLRQRIAQNILNNGQQASGQTIQSLRVETAPETGRLYARPYFGTLETGRKAGPVPKGFAEIIEEWTLNKGLGLQFDKKYKLQSFAYLVARKIWKEGTKLHRTGGRSDIYSKEIPITVNNISKRMATVIAGGISTGKQIKLNL